MGAGAGAGRGGAGAGTRGGAGARGARGARGAGVRARSARQGPGPGGAGHWGAFSAAAGGHWRGVQATFSGAGEPQELPAIYVPEAFREWGDGLYDWQTHCSVACGDPPACGVDIVVRRLVPLAACESVNIETVDESYSILRTDVDRNLGEAKTVLSDGSFSAGTRELDREKVWRVEHCLATGEDERVRVVQRVNYSEWAGGWVAKTLQVDAEERLPSPPAPGEDPLDGRVVVDDRIFATSAPVLATEVSDGQRWGGFQGILYENADGRFAERRRDGEAAEEARCPLRSDSAGLLGLPLGVWSRVEQVGEDVVVLEAGVVRGASRTFSRRVYEGAGLRLTQVVIGSEAAA